MSEKNSIFSVLDIFGVFEKTRHEEFITPNIDSLRKLGPEKRLAIKMINKHFSNAIRHVEIINNISGAEKDLINCYDISKKYELDRMIPGVHSTFIALLSACILEDLIIKAYKKEKYDYNKKNISDSLHLVGIAIEELDVYHKRHDVEVSNVLSVYLMLYSIISAYKGEYDIALDYARKSHSVDSSNVLAEEMIDAIKKTKSIRPKLIRALQKDLEKGNEDNIVDIKDYSEELFFAIFDEELREFDVKLNNDKYLLNKYKGEAKSHTHFSMNFLENKENWRISMMVLEYSIKVLTKISANEISYLNKLEAISNIPESQLALKKAA